MRLLRLVAGPAKFHSNFQVYASVPHGIPAFSALTRTTAPARVPHRISRRHSISTTAAMASTDATLRAFFQASKYAVVGASTNPEKYGYKVFRWYVTHNLPVTPINPGAPAVEVDGRAIPTVASLSALPEPEGTAVSVITPPPVTRKALEEAKSLGIRAVFLQPGTFDDEVLAFARESFETVLAGEGGAGGEGWCVLVDGERGLQAAGKL